MPLAETQKLLDIYGGGLKKGTLSKQAFIELMLVRAGTYRSVPDVSTSDLNSTFDDVAPDFVNIASFSPAYDPDRVVSNVNYDTRELSCDFVHTLCQDDWLVETLHALNSRIINTTVGTLADPYTSIAKAFLAYELLINPVGASALLESKPIKKLFSSPDKMRYFKNIELYSMVRRFRSKLAYSTLSQTEGENALILDDLHRKIAFEGGAISTEITQLIAIVRETQNRLRPPHSMIYLNHLLSHTLSLLEGRILPEDYRRIIDLSSLKTIVVQPTPLKKVAGLTSMALGGIIALCGGGSGPAIFFASTGLKAFEAESQQTGIEGIIHRLAELVAADARPRQPSLHHILEDDPDSAAMTASAASQPTPQGRRSQRIRFFLPPSELTKTDQGLGEEYVLVPSFQGSPNE